MTDKRKVPQNFIMGFDGGRNRIPTGRWDNRENQLIIDERLMKLNSLGAPQTPLLLFSLLNSVRPV